MHLESWARIQIEKGNIEGAKKARELIEQYGDVSITLPSKEQQKGVLRFSQEALQDLEEQGYLIYELTEQSIKSLKEQNKRFNSVWHRDFPKFEALTSRKSEAAINPKQLFLKDSNRKTYEQQEEMVKEFSEELSRRVRGIEVIIGEASDYLELAFKHLDKTSERLFGEKYNYYYTITKTPTEGLFLATIGNFDVNTSLDVSRRHRDAVANNVWVSPLVVPARIPA